MQIVTEGLALYAFRDMRNATEEPLLKQLLTYVSRDEARHTGYGIKYLSAVRAHPLRRGEGGPRGLRVRVGATPARLARRESRCATPCMSIWSAAGVDPATALAELAKERDTLVAAIQKSGGRRGPVRGFVIPTLRSIGLFSPRIEAHFDEMFSTMPGAGLGRIANDPKEIPEDLEAWVNEGA